MPGNRWTAQDESMLLLCLIKVAGVKLSAVYCDRISKMMGGRFSGNAIRQKLMKKCNEANDSGAFCDEGYASLPATPKKSPRSGIKKKPKKDSSDESMPPSPHDFDSPMVDASMSPPRRLPQRTKRPSVSYRELEGDLTDSSDEDIIKLESDVLGDQTEI